MRRWCAALAVTLAWLWSPSAPALAQRFQVEPYLQDATPTRVTVAWETNAGTASAVEYGALQGTARTVRAQTKRGGLSRRFHAAELGPLTPGARYWYRVRTGDLIGARHEFRAPLPPEAQANVRMLVLADMQWDLRDPQAFRDLVTDGLAPLARTRGGFAETFDLALIAGDLVRDGTSHRAWTHEFFAPLAQLAREVPLYPVIGNHERNDPLYFRYFTLPNNGPPGLAEHAYFVDRGNVRLIGLDSNEGYRTKEQLLWLERVLADACRAPYVDFIVAAAHHPERSELWPRGDTAYTGLLAERLERAANACEKPALLVTGHTHGYARGHSRDHALTTIIVGSAGGRIDHFGDHPQVDYGEIVTSQDDYGFVLLETTRGTGPTLRITRVGRGDERRKRANRVRDELVLKRHNQAPLRPEGLSPRDELVDPEHAILVASPFRDVDGDAFGALHVQLTGGTCDFSAPLMDRWVQHQNEWRGRNLVTPEDARRVVLPRLPAGTDYCYRLRVRDRALAWSEWSEPARFRTTPRAVAER